MRRIVALANPSRNVPIQLDELDAAFAKKRALTLIRIIPGLRLVPFQFSSSFGSRHTIGGRSVL
jgi:hypothetical protein